jgi:hypothetical protein
MKQKSAIIQSPLVLLALLATFNSQLSTAHAQGTAFTYQGRLSDGTNPATGNYDLSFTLYSAVTGGTVSGALTNTAIGVTNGLFTTTLDFGAVFNGANYWLELAARTNGGGALITMTPRQPITSAPYAIYSANANSANSVAAANIVGTVPLALLPPIADSLLSSNIARLNIPNTNLQATANVVLVSGFIVDTTNLYGGVGYISNPLVTVTDVSGSNAVITATVSNGVVASLTVQTAGLHYSAGATLTIAPPPSSAVQAFGNINIFTNVNNSFAGTFNGSFGGLTGGTLTLSSNLNLPPTTVGAGIIYSGASTFIHGYGNQNFFAGAGAGNLTLTGNANVGVGFNALHNNTSGSRNTANGYLVLNHNTTGNENTANGSPALQNNTSGNDNTADGFQTLGNNTTGIDNTASGAYALLGNTSGSFNSAYGFNALWANTTGNYNTAIGWGALELNTAGGNNTAHGAYALWANTTGVENTANGAGALQNNTVGIQNTANGYQALFSNTNGNFNAANGYQALYSNTSGSDNTANGDWSLNQNTTGSQNSANGHQALYGNTIGVQNTANGDLSLHNNTSGSQNTASGFDALTSNTTGPQNTASGAHALGQNTVGGYNTADGWAALFNNSSGNLNTAVGQAAMDLNASGANNVALGYSALFSNVVGNANIALGYQAGYTITNGSNNIDIGNVGTPSDNNTILIGAQGTQTNTAIAGIYGATAASGVPVYVTTSGQLGTLTSSARFKQNIRSMNDASDVLLALHPVMFQYKPGIDPQGIPQFGLVAEEVDKVDPDLVARDDKNQIYTVRYEAVNAMLLNEFQKEHRKVEAQNSEIENLKQNVAELKQLVQTLAVKK